MVFHLLHRVSSRMLAFSQSIHTAGVIAARFGRIDILDHLFSTTSLSVSRLETCGACVMCPEVGVLGKTKCTEDHEAVYSMTLAHGAAAGGHIPVLAYLKSRGANLSAVDAVRHGCFRTFVFASVKVRVSTLELPAAPATPSYVCMPAGTLGDCQVVHSGVS